MLLSPTSPSALSNKCHLSLTSATSRCFIGRERRALWLFQGRQQSLTLPYLLHRSSRLEASLQCDKNVSLSPRNQGSVIHGVSETIVGVLGGGQLGRMLCQAASQMAVKVITLDPQECCPASSLSYQHFVGRFDDGDAVTEFAKRCEVLTIEIEHVDAITLEKLEEQGVDCQPKPLTIRIIQDKYIQKVHFSQHGIPHPDFMKIDNLESAEKAATLFGFPLMLKSRRHAYDGRGNAIAHHKDELYSAVAALGGYDRGLYAERWTSFRKELSVIVARGRDGSVLCYPVVETIHKDSICHIVDAPADVPEKIKELSEGIALKAVSSLEGAGVFAVELFLTLDGQVLLNEVAPRPHNSGHHTIESCYTSQYEQHLRAVIGLTLGDTSMKTPYAIMYNILGEDEGEKGFYLAHQLMKRALNIPRASVHWYGKSEMRKLRKMGHITIVGPSRNHVKNCLDLMLNRESTIFSASDPKVSIIMGSDSDLTTMKDAAEILNTFHVPFELTIVSAHRTPERMHSFALSAKERGIQVIIAGAGGAAHLPGMVASLTPLPVIGVPIWTSSLNGVDSLLSIAQMPKGIPVATVEIGNASKAALLAVRVLANKDDELLERLIKYHEELRDPDLERADKLEGEDTQVAIIMNSDSDLTTMDDVAEILNTFHVSFKLTILPAHQTRKWMYSFALSAKEMGIQVIIASAGDTGLLPGMLASLTVLPVIGVPIRTSSFDGVNSLMSIMQTPKDIPVATVAVENAVNAALLAVRMLATRDDELLKRLIKYHEELRETILEKAGKLEEVGWEKYLKP